ncbi:uncharacterized protein LOC117167979 [Belonocnema kinseyi]|uniref:uncharacterized protein LOC117167979 n=1 Tax=Belonocnema kinseyi TaxID=2817044 RepID=UPI00143CE247|nr:uncharacterized protein LOC117167979 [Belonocnema kinseyi]
MKICTVGLFLTLAVFLNYIENSLAWLGRKNGRIAAEPYLHVPIRSYEDHADRIHHLQVGSNVTLGIRKLEVEGVRSDYIIGIVKYGVIRPILDAYGFKFIVCMRSYDTYGLLNTNGVPYGLEPEHTVDAMITAPSPTVHN